MTTQAAAEPADARGILMRMAEFLANTPRFSVTIQDRYDVVQASGEKIEFGAERKLTVSRPDRLRVELERSDGDRSLVLFDGQTITVLDPEQNVYAQAVKPSGIDDMIVFFVQDLKMRLPLALMLVSRFPDEIKRRTQSLDYVEGTVVQGVPAHHLAGRTETMDYQVWVAEGGQPWPLRVVLTYKNAEGQPQFRAQFSEWNPAPDIQDAMFAFTPPQGARKIAFLAQLPQIVARGAKPAQ